MIELVFTKPGFMIGSIFIDAVVRETHHLAAELTQHPVEDGSDLSDHYRPAPRAVELEGVITDMPLELPQSHANGARKVQSPIELAKELFGMQLGPIPISISGSPQMGSVNTFSPEMTRVQSTWDEFVAIFEQRKLITIVTSLDIYADMGLSNLEAQKLGKSYSFTCFGMQVRTAKSSKVAAFKAKPKVERAKPMVDKGKQEPPPVSTSLAKKALDALLAMGGH